MTMTRLDHLVLATTDLAAGTAWLTDALGVPPGGGGRHPLMATHNALWSLGPSLYLELIAIDPAPEAPAARRRWYGLDDPAILARLATTPHPVPLTWVVQTDQLAAAEAVLARFGTVGTAIPVSRGAFRWQITVPDDDTLPGDGLIPTLICWDPGSPHPTGSLADHGLRLDRLALTGPQGGGLAGLTTALDLPADQAARIAPGTADRPAVTMTLTTATGASVTLR